MSDLFGAARTVLSVLGDVGTIIAVAGAVACVWLWAKGILPVVLRLGKGLAKRKIALFAKGDHLGSLSALLTDSGLIDGANIIDIALSGDIGKSEKASIYLVHWGDWGSEIEEILRRKKDSDALIVYAAPGAIPVPMMAKVDGARNAIVANFRGRALNDVIIAMMSTSGAGR
ncbi:MAG: hypothetical protein HY778_00090 [Betaproteobacteria bacterium]|nr:hypothetical protein [Betaproteobacteria bacterium]